MRRTTSEMDLEKSREKSVVRLSILKVGKVCGSQIMPSVFGN